MTMPTQAQVDYVRSLQKKLRLPNTLLDGHCIRKYDGPFASLDIRQVTLLLNEMIGWKAIPADLQREQGQRDLPGFGAVTEGGA